MASPALIAAAALAALAPPGPESPMMVAKKISASYRKAMFAKDVAYFEKNTTKDMVYIGAKGDKLPRAQALEGVRMGLGMYKKIKSIDDKIVSARRAEGGVLIVTDRKMEATLDMGGKIGNMVSVLRGEALVVPSGKDWVYKRIKVLKEDTRIDGKPVEM